MNKFHFYLDKVSKNKKYGIFNEKTGPDVAAILDRINIIKEKTDKIKKIIEYFNKLSNDTLNAVDAAAVTAAKAKKQEFIKKYSLLTDDKGIRQEISNLTNSKGELEKIDIKDMIEKKDSKGNSLLDDYIPNTFLAGIGSGLFIKQIESAYIEATAK